MLTLSVPPVTSIHDGSLAKAEFESFPVFNLSVPKSVNNVPNEILDVSDGRLSGSVLPGPWAPC